MVVHTYIKEAEYVIVKSVAGSVAQVIIRIPVVKPALT